MAEPAGKSKRSNLEEFFEHGKEASQAVRSLSGRTVKPKASARGNRGRGSPVGRPSREQTGQADVARAPFPELATAPAAKLYGIIRKIDDVGLLKQAHRFEVAHLRRQTVLLWVEDRLRQLGAPLGGPRAQPVRGYNRLSVPELLDLVEQESPEFAATVYAWEHYHQRRPHVMRVAAERCGAAGDQLVEATAPFRGHQDLPEPFAGFRALSTSPSGRSRLRAALRSQPAAALERAKEYEAATLNRVTMLNAIELALRQR